MQPFIGHENGFAHAPSLCCSHPQPRYPDAALGSAPLMDVNTRQLRAYWPMVIGLSLLHAVAALGVWYWASGLAATATLVAALVWYAVTGIGISAGYHRGFSHRTFQMSAPLRWFLLTVGAGALEGSAIEWSSDHRDHHRGTDGPDDPYSVKHGFLWAHMGWIMFRVPRRRTADRTSLADLKAMPGVLWQHRNFRWFGPLVSFGLPAAVASLWGDFWGGLLVAGVLRLVVLFHATWCINSLAHTIGRRGWNPDSSARDSWITALITFGEGYHNFHHRFPTDYRNGVRAWHYDPTKWLLWLLDRVRLARDLRRTRPDVLRRVRASVRAARRAA